MSDRGLQSCRGVCPALLVLLPAVLTGCGGGSSYSGGGTSSYTIGGTVSGLPAGESVGLLDNGGDALAVPASGSFTFATALASGSAYAVTVGTQPTGATCAVSSGSGTLASANVTNVSVTCTATAPTHYSVGGEVSGLTAGQSVTLLDNGSDALKVSANGTFTFTTELTSAAAYAVTIQTQPAGEICTVSNGSGSIGAANITHVGVSCAAAAAGESVLYSFGAFRGPDGAYPGWLIQGLDGDLYGVTQSGGTNELGSVFKLTTAGSESVLYSFDQNATSSITSNADAIVLVQASDGTLYGISHNGGTVNAGSFFKVSGGTGTILYSFGVAALDGSFPTGLTLGSDGNFYGVASFGGGNFTGSVFKITPAGVESTLYSFGSTTSGDGNSALGNLVQASDGTFYGVTTGGGANGTGAVFTVTPAGAEAVIYSFGPKTGTDAQSPAGGLVQGSDGNFYGLTGKGGANGTGAIYKITPTGTETVLYSFGPPVNAQDPKPIGPLLLATDGNFYGTTESGGTLNAGTVFRLTPGGTETIIHSFTAQGTDVAGPLAGLIQGTDGNLYGSAASGGAHSTGGVFRITL